MKISFHYWFFILVILFVSLCVSSCSHRIHKEVYNDYTNIDSSRAITLYQGSNKPAPDAEVVATLTQKHSYKSEDETVMKMMDIARHAGGKGLWIYDISELAPVTFASVIREKDSISHSPMVNVNSMEAILRSQINQVRLQKAAIPVVSYALDIGYGYMPARTPGYTGDEADYEDHLSSGMIWRFTFKHHPSGMNGWGLTFNRYTSSASIDSFTTKYQSNYLGVLYSFSNASPNKKFLINTDFGLGIVYSKWDNSLSSVPDIFAINVASHINVGVDYKLSPYFALGLNLGALYYSFSTVYINDQSASLAHKMNGTTYSLSLGVKYTFPRKKPVLL